MFQPTAKIIADSVNPNGDRLTTFEINLHRYVLAEFNTHRVNSRNFQSSRACPVERMIANILKEDEMVYPLHWGRKQKGMVADLEIDEADQLEAIAIWDEARKDMIRHVRRLLEIDVHKQVANRLLEPFMAITGIVTATDYSNFFAQRCHPDAQPEIQALANAMKAAYDASVPERLEAGEWHLPLINGEDWVDATDRGYVEEDMIKVSIGRCARVSYLNHDGLRSLSDDTKLYWRLLEAEPPHLSPFEHCAVAMPNSDKYANFAGWQSYRNQLEESLKC
jgi:thymidylate synthase ThyX